MTSLTLKKVARFFVYISLVTPLLVFPSHFIFPFIVPKVVFFRSLMVLAGLTVFLTWFYEHKETDKMRPNKFWTPLTLVLLMYLLSLIISTVFGVDWRFSLWNNHERMLGLFTIVHYFILFFTCRYLFKTWVDWRKLFSIFGAVGIVVVNLAIIQKLYPDFFYNKGSHEVISSLGNPIYLAGYGLFLSFVGTLCGLQETGKWWRSYFFIVSALGIAAIFLANTRGTIVGLASGLGLIGVIYICLMWNTLLKKNRYVILITTSLLLTLLISVFIFRQTSLVRSIPVLDHLSTLDFSDTSIQTRFMAWDVAWSGFLQRPIFGWGMNNYYYVFNQFYNPDFLKFGFQETWFDNAHNVFFNTLAEQGGLGLSVYLAIFIMGAYYLRNIYMCTHNKPIVLVGSAFLVGHLVHNFFVFENVTSYLYFFLFLAFLDSLYRNKHVFFNVADEKSKLFFRRIPVWGLVGVFMLSFGIILVTNINVAIANNHGYNAQGFTAISHRYELGLEYYLNAKKWRSPYQDEIHLGYSSKSLDVLPDMYVSSSSTARHIYDVFFSGMETYIEHHPRDVRSRLFFTDLLRAGIVLFDLPLRDMVNEQFKIAHELSPGRQQIGYAELSFMAGTGNIKEALAGAKQMIIDYPYSAEGYYNLARFYFYDNQMLEILPVLDSAIRTHVFFTDPVHIAFVAQAYEREGRFRDALYWWDQLYKTSGDQGTKLKRDELSQLTKKPVPQSLEEFFEF